VKKWVGGEKQPAPVPWAKIMICYESTMKGTRREAVALCNNCNAALCADHAEVVSSSVTVQYPVAKIIVLPLRARHIYCSLCNAALQQRHSESAVRASLRR
jgi:hypothetical protein